MIYLEKLWPLKVEDMYGVGEKTAKKLHKINIQTIGDLAKADEYTLSQLLGINGERLKNVQMELIQEKLIRMRLMSLRVLEIHKRYQKIQRMKGKFKNC